MNLYEEKFVGFIVNLRSKISNITKEISTTEDSILAKKKHKKDILNVIEDTNIEVVRQVLGKELIGVANEIDEMVMTKADLLVSLDVQREKLELLQQICPHADTEYHSYDHHKNEEYYQCKLCGRII
jgi:hypothetical protein